VAENEEVVLDYKFGLNPKDAIKAATQFQKEMSKRLKLVEKSEDRVNKSISKYLIRMGTAKRVFTPVLQKQIKLYDATVAAIEESRKAVANLQGEVASYEDTLKALRALESQSHDDAKKAAQDEIKQVLELKKAKEKTLTQKLTDKSTQQEALKMIDKVASEARVQLKVDPSLLPEAAMEAGQELVKPFKAFAHRDLASAMEEGGALAAKAFKLAQKASKMDTSDKGMGVMLKSFAGLSKSMSPILSMISEMAPMLKLAGTFAMGLVKMFIGAEAAATEFNKQVLASSTASGFMADNAQDVTKSVRDTEKFMHALNMSANDFGKNFSRAMNKDMVSGVISQLGAEGQDLRRIRKELDMISKSTTTAAKDVKDFNDVTFISVAYSRQFGVSLAEVTQLQGEMMTEIGMSLTETETAFANMDRSAEQAGIASNKFFGIIRGFSADLSLFTLRMEDLTKVMTVLGKTMSPRNAQKFLSTVTQQFKGASLMDRTKSVLLGGKKEMKGIVKSDADRRLDALGKDLQNVLDPAKLKTLVKGGTSEKNTQDLMSYLSQFGDKITGAQTDAILDAARMQGKLASDDALDIASAIKDASPIAAIKLLQQISEKRFGKPLEQLTGLERAAIEQMANIGDEQIDQMYKFNAGTIKTKTDLVAKLTAYQKAIAGGKTEDEAKKVAGLTKVEAGMLLKLGVKLDDANAAALVGQKSSDDIWNSMDTSQQQLLKEVDATKKFQEQTASLQRSISDAMGLLVDFVTTKFYTLVMEIYDAIMGIWDSFSIFGKGKPTKSWKGQVAGATGGGERDQWTQLRAVVSKMTSAQKDAYNAEIKKAGGRGNLTLEQQLQRAAKYTAKEQAKAATKPAAKAAVATAPTQPVEVKEGPTGDDQADTTKSVKQVTKTLKKGVALGRPSNDYKTSAEDSTLSAIRQGLFEYYLYSSLDKNDVATAMQQGLDPMAFAAGITNAVQQTGSVGAAYQAMRPHAAGGLVTGISGDAATVGRFPPAPPGEGWASVGPGERITPAGGRGGAGGPVKVELIMKQDLRRFIQARVVDGHADFERNKRLR
jgi:DNA-binding ferritin-like protein (Dps family)